MARAYWQNGKGWRSGTPEEYLGLERGVVSLVGGGGKTTLLFYLAVRLQSRGKRVGIMTTTRIYRPPLLCATAAECRERWQAGQYAVAGRDAPGGKIALPDPGLVDFFLSEADILLIEADGAKHLPCKVPGEREPVLPPQTTHVIGVMGLDALDCPIEACCFRPERAAALLGCSAGHPLTPRDMATLLLSPQGTKKSVGNRHYAILLNKCDDNRGLERGKAVMGELERQGHTKTALTCFTAEERGIGYGQ